MPADVLEVEVMDSPSWGGGVLDNMTSVTIVLDLGAPSEASFEVGDDGSFAEIARALGPGQRYSVRLNGRRLLAGRIEARDVPVDARAGAVCRFTVRSWLADAVFTSARTSIDVKNGTLKDFVLAAYEPLGIGEDRFVFTPSVARNLRTGKLARGKDPSIRLERLKVEQARVQPGESIFAAVDRHLRRFGLMQWDGPDDTIVVGFPNQGQEPIYDFRVKRDPATREGNNVLAMTRTEDYSNVPTQVIVHGGRFESTSGWVRASGEARDADAITAGFVRPVDIVAQGIRNNEAAKNAAERELAARVQSKDLIELETDRLSYLDLSNQQVVPYAPDTVASVDTDVAGGQVGAYYVSRVTLTRDAFQGDISRLSMLRAGLWRLFPDAYEGTLTG